VYLLSLDEVHAHFFFRRPQLLANELRGKGAPGRQEFDRAKAKLLGRGASSTRPITMPDRRDRSVSG
jgi:hypothetical protein